MEGGFNGVTEACYADHDSGGDQRLAAVRRESAGRYAAWLRGIDEYAGLYNHWLSGFVLALPHLFL